MLRNIVLSFSLLTIGTACAENMFNTVLGKSDEETRQKIDSVWNHFFTPGDISLYENDGQKSVYYLSGDDSAFIMDTGSNDVRTEGMSYGMMISVQLDKRDEFDRLWNWSKRHMAYDKDSAWDGYFCWQCKPDGTKIGVAMLPMENYITSHLCYLRVNDGMNPNILKKLMKYCVR